MSLTSVGEFPLIARLSAVLGAPRNESLLLGIGDDAAVWRPTPGALTVATADGLVAGVHFDLATTSWTDLGWKVIAENVSDVAAMGCRPRYALLTLALPPTIDPADIEALYRGVRECAEAYGCLVVGGDVVAAREVVISVVLLGESASADASVEPPVLRRSAARPGDLLAVTGTLGASAAGLRILARASGGGDQRQVAVLTGVHRRPVPRVAAGQALIEAGVRCAIDVSDGLVADVRHICERSGVDGEIDAARIPIHPLVLECFPAEALQLALTGGEDYELACAGPAETVERANQLLRDRGEPGLTVIGRVVRSQAAEPAVRVSDAVGNILALPADGYRHFAVSPDGTGPDDA